MLRDSSKGALMKIHNIYIHNFKKFNRLKLDLDSQFTLIVGENGSGKTTILDALAVASAVWLVEMPDSKLVNSRRSILPKEVRLAPLNAGDRVQFVQHKPVVVEVDGEICGQAVTWRRQIREGGHRTTNAEAREAVALIADHYARVREGHAPLSPVVAYYGAGRAWLPARERARAARKNETSEPARRWDAFYDCFDERIRVVDLMRWFRREAVAAINQGHWRAGYEVVKCAVLRCVPDAEELWFDADRDEVALSIANVSQPFSNLSAGQQMMLATVADIAMKAVTQNAHLLPDVSELSDSFGQDELPTVLRETPGLVLIDELDVHLHPRWQRRVVRDLRETFPSIQFVCTSHSPFIIQSINAGELRLLDAADSPLEYADRPIEDIAEDVQGIDIPQRSQRSQEFVAAATHYFELLGSAPEEGSEELRAAELAYRVAADRYSETPGLDAVLRLEALARNHAPD